MLRSNLFLSVSFCSRSLFRFLFSRTNSLIYCFKNLIYSLLSIWPPTPLKRASSDLILITNLTFSSVNLDRYSSNLAVSSTIYSMQLKESSAITDSSSSSTSLLTRPHDSRMAPTMLATVYRVAWSRNWYFFMISTTVSVILSKDLTAFSLWAIYSSSFSRYLFSFSS